MAACWWMRRFPRARICARSIARSRVSQAWSITDCFSTCVRRWWRAAPAARGCWRWTMKVLVADDDVVSRTILDKLLRKLGYEPVLTANGREALAQIVREEIPLLVSDWQMPDI